MAIRKSKELGAVLGSAADVRLCETPSILSICISDVVPAQGGAVLHAPVYHLLPADLRLSPSTTLNSLLTSPISDANAELVLSPSLPTLLLFECVLVYMSPASSSAVLQWFVNYFSQPTAGGALGSIVYEMFGLEDSFGRGKHV